MFYDKEFSEKYYHSRAWENTKWLGYRVFKPPTDLMIQQEIITKTCPTLIIETGTYEGGSALFYASVLHGLDKKYEIEYALPWIRLSRTLVTIDIKDRVTDEFKTLVDANLKVAAKWINGSSLNPQVVDTVKAIVKSDKVLNGEYSKVMVVLDSNHTMKHVFEELLLYAPLVSKGCYLIVEDTIISSTISPQDHPGPAYAVEAFLEGTKTGRDFEVDPACEKYGLTFMHGGYLKRTS